MKQTPLSQLAIVSAGQAAPKDDEFSDHGTPFVRAGSLDRLLSRKTESDLELVSEETAKLRKLKTYPKGTILFAKSGMSATKDRIYVLQNPAYVVSHLATLIPNGNAHADYLRLALKRFPPSVLIKDPAYPSISLGDIQGYEIPVPEQRDDQLRIAHLLGKVEVLIVQRKQHLQQLDDLLKSVFLEMFGDPVRNEKAWKTIPFDQIGKFRSGGTPSKSKADYWVGSYPWVSPKDMKVSKISDSEDHISEIVFDETTLKRIAPNHLLIVVRGMILAHSFPIAINTVDIAINQDMKAILPRKEVCVVYLHHCLTALKRQILKLISTAGHGTKKFDSNAMKKLLIPIPPPELQKKYSAMAEKVEVIKDRYQQSLTDLEALYGVLSQQAFKGELDLSRVSPPKEVTQPMPVDAAMPIAEVFTPTELVGQSEQSAEPLARDELLARWFRQYLANTPPATGLRAAEMLDGAWQALQTAQLEVEVSGEEEEEEDPPDLADYDVLKALVFKALDAGELLQTFDDDRNRVGLKRQSAEWGTW